MIIELLVLMEMRVIIVILMIVRGFLAFRDFGVDGFESLGNLGHNPLYRSWGARGRGVGPHPSSKSRSDLRTQKILSDL